MAIQLGAGVDKSAVSHREPVNTVSGERKGRHIQRSRFAEDAEPCQSGQQVDACKELHEAGHPETPQAQASVDFRTGLGKTKQSLTTPDKVAGTQAKKTNGDRHEGRTCKRECLRFHFMSPFFEVCALIFLSITAALDDYYESFSTARK